LGRKTDGLKGHGEQGNDWRDASKRLNTACCARVKPGERLQRVGGIQKNMWTRRGVPKREPREGHFKERKGHPTGAAGVLGKRKRRRKEKPRGGAGPPSIPQIGRDRSIGSFSSSKEKG